jgi:hypothetical protein
MHLHSNVTRSYQQSFVDGGKTVLSFPMIDESLILPPAEFYRKDEVEKFGPELVTTPYKDIF